MCDHTIPEQGGRKGPVHLQCLTQYPSSRIIHCVQPSLLHQPAHLVHMGSLLAPVFHGHQMARRNWRHICSPQRKPTCWSPTRFPASVARRSRMWPTFPQWSSTFYVSPSALYHAHELPWRPSQSQHASLSWLKKPLSLLTCFACVLVLVHLVPSHLFVCSQHLAPAVPWPNVIPCLPVSRILRPLWACHVATHGDPVVMDFPVALLLLRTHLLRLAAPLTLQLPMLDLPSYLPDQMNIHPTMGTQRQTWPHPFQLQLITRLQFFQDCRKKPIHSKGNYQKLVVSFTHTTWLKFKLLQMTIPNRHFADLWSLKWTDEGTIETCSRSSTSMGSSATFVLVATDGLTLGINRPNSPTIGAAIFRFQSSPRREIGTPIMTTLQKAQSQYKNQYKNLAWMTPTPSSPMWTLLHHLSRFNNWQPSSGTFSTMTGMPTWQYSNVWRIQMMTSHDIRLRSSRRETWLILPVIWQNRPVCCLNKPVAWRHSLMRPCEL